MALKLKRDTKALIEMLGKKVISLYPLKTKIEWNEINWECQLIDIMNKTKNVLEKMICCPSKGVGETKKMTFRGKIISFYQHALQVCPESERIPQLTKLYHSYPND